MLCSRFSNVPKTHTWVWINPILTGKVNNPFTLHPLSDRINSRMGWQEGLLMAWVGGGGLQSAPGEVRMQTEGNIRHQSNLEIIWGFLFCSFRRSKPHYRRRFPLQINSLSASDFRSTDRLIASQIVARKRPPDAIRASPNTFVII